MERRGGPGAMSLTRGQLARDAEPGTREDSRPAPDHVDATRAGVTEPGILMPAVPRWHQTGQPALPPSPDRPGWAKSPSTALILRGIAALILGIMALAWPGITVYTLVILSVVFAFIAAGLQAVLAFSGGTG